MLYMPASTLATPIVFQETKPVLTAPYYILQPTAIIPTVPLFNTALIYPQYSLVTKSIQKDESQTKEQIQPVQHVVHHYLPSSSVKTCSGYCELCCPWIEDKPETRSRSPTPPRSPSPPTHDHQQQQQQQRYSRRDIYDKTVESIDDKIERIRRELDTTTISKHDKSTETIDYYHPLSRKTIPERVPYKQHYDAPKPRSTSRSRSASSHRASSLSREPWRPTNQNDYPWRDSHLPAYRQATFERMNEKTAHQQSHSNTKTTPTSYYNKKDYVYRPKSESEAKRWYVQSTGKDPDREVYQSLHDNSTNYQYNGSSSSSTTYGNQQQTNDYNYSYYTDIPTTTTKTHSLHKLDTTQYHNLYGCNEPCLHIVPKQGSTLDPPYLKIINAPITYLH